MVVKLKQISEQDILLLDEFLRNAGHSLEKFRYFSSRPLLIIKNHVITLLLFEDGLPKGYGHLDLEGDTIWLGIAINEKCKGKGYGNKIMEQLILYAIENDIKSIKLSVDKDNVSAINLYNKFGFNRITELNDTSILMLLDLNEIK